MMTRTIGPLVAGAITLGTLAVTLMGAASPLPMKAPLVHKVDAVVRAALKAQNVPGIGVAIAEHGRIVYAKGFGFRNLGDGLPVNAGTTFRIGSITKQFTASAIMLLQQEGKLNVDDPLSTYLPSAPYARQMTLRELLTHTSGMPDFTVPESFDAASKLPITPAGIVASVSREPLDFKPGTLWEYSNTGYTLLGMVIEKVSGETYETFVRTHLLRPLNLSSIRFWNGLSIYPDASRGYTTLPFEPPLNAVDWNWDWAWAVGNLNADPSDLARWDVDLDTGNVVSWASFAMMSTAQKLKNGHSTGYGFGLGVGKILGRKYLDHTGGVPGFITDNFTIPQDGVAIVVLGNSDSFQPGVVTQEITNLVYGAKPKPPKIVIIHQSAVQKARARRYLTAMLTGRFSSIPLREDAARYLKGVVAKQYVNLGDRLGALGKTDLIGTDKRPPVTSYYYRSHFAHATVLYSLALDANGTVAGIGVQAWP